MKTILELTSQQLRRAAQIREQIDSLEKQLQGILGEAQGAPAARGNGGLSSAARAKISAAAKARWAKIKASGGKSFGNPGRKGGRKQMSAAQKAKIAAALKARWAKIKAGKK